MNAHGWLINVHKDFNCVFLLLDVYSLALLADRLLLPKLANPPPHPIPVWYLINILRFQVVMVVMVVVRQRTPPDHSFIVCHFFIPSLSLTRIPGPQATEDGCDEWQKSPHHPHTQVKNSGKWKSLIMDVDNVKVHHSFLSLKHL